MLIAKKLDVTEYEMTRQLAPYATHTAQSKGRFYQEDSDARSLFQRDRDRIVHSSAFRRLQYKTQVFIYHEGDHYRSRLTHSLEVAQISRSIARSLNLDEDLSEAIALAHDLGHTPFGHSGEHALNDVMPKEEGFDHNAQSFSVLTSLESRYAGFNGLNLTWETLEGVLKHNGPIDLSGDKISSHMKNILTDYLPKHDLEVKSFAGPEAQIAAISDDIAYNCHDIDDGLRAGFIDLSQLRELTFIDQICYEIECQYENLEFSRFKHELQRRLVSLCVFDVMQESQNRLHSAGCKTVEDIRAYSQAVIAFSPVMQKNIEALRRFMYEKVYYHSKLLAISKKTQNMVRELYRLFDNDLSLLPQEWQESIQSDKSISKARQIANYIAGMTDRFAMEEYKSLVMV